MEIVSLKFNRFHSFCQAFDPITSLCVRVSDKIQLKSQHNVSGKVKLTLSIVRFHIVMVMVKRSIKECNKMLSNNSTFSMSYHVIEQATSQYCHDRHLHLKRNFY